MLWKWKMSRAQTSGIWLSVWLKRCETFCLSTDLISFRRIALSMAAARRHADYYTDAQSAFPACHGMLWIHPYEERIHGSCTSNVWRLKKENYNPNLTNGDIISTLMIRSSIDSCVCLIPRWTSPHYNDAIKPCT